MRRGLRTELRPVASSYCSGGEYRAKTPPSAYQSKDAVGFQVETVGINATLETTSPVDLAEGQVGPEQRLGMKLLDSQGVLGCLRNRVAVLCVGHSHRQEVTKPQGGLPWLSAAGSPRETDGYLLIGIADGAPAQVSVQEATITQPREEETHVSLAFPVLSPE